MTVDTDEREKCHFKQLLYIISTASEGEAQGLNPTTTV